MPICCVGDTCVDCFAHAMGERVTWFTLDQACGVRSQISVSGIFCTVAISSSKKKQTSWSVLQKVLKRSNRKSTWYIWCKMLDPLKLANNIHATCHSSCLVHCVPIGQL